MASEVVFSAVPKPSSSLRLSPATLAFDASRLGDTATRQLRLKNPTSNAAVAYKLRTTHPGLFRVKQSEGLLRPGESREVVITMKPLKTLEIDGVPKFQLLSVGVGEGDMEARRMHWDSVPAALLHRHVIPCRFAALQSSGDEEEVQAGSSSIPPVALPAHQQQDLPTGRALVVLLRHVSRSRKHRKGHEEVEEEEADEELQRIKAETSPRRYKAWVKHARGLARAQRRSGKGRSEEERGPLTPRLLTVVDPSASGRDEEASWTASIASHRQRVVGEALALPPNRPAALQASSSSLSNTTTSTSSSSSSSSSPTDLLPRHRRSKSRTKRLEPLAKDHSAVQRRAEPLGGGRGEEEGRRSVLASFLEGPEQAPVVVEEEREKVLMREARGRAAAVHSVVQTLRRRSLLDEPRASKDGRAVPAETRGPQEEKEGGQGRVGQRQKQREGSSAQRRLEEKVAVVASLASGLSASQSSLRDAVVDGFNAMSAEIVAFASLLHRVCLRHVAAAELVGDEEEERGRAAPRLAGGVQPVLGVCRVVEGRGRVVRAVGNRDVEVCVSGGNMPLRRFRFDRVVSGRRRAEEEAAEMLAEVDGAVLAAVREGGVFCLVACSAGEGGGLVWGQGGGRGLLAMAVDMLHDEFGEEALDYTVTALEVQGEHVRDLLGRPAGTASRGLYGLCFDQQGQAYVSNVLQVELRGVRDVERICDVLSGREQEDDEEEEQWQQEWEDEVASAGLVRGAGWGPTSPALRSEGYRKVQQRALLTVLHVTRYTGGRQQPETTAECCSRLYFVELLPPRQPSDRPVRCVLDATLRRRRAIRTAFQPWSISEGEGRLAGLLVEALSPMSRVVVLARADEEQAMTSPHDTLAVLHMAAGTSGPQPAESEQRGSKSSRSSHFGSDDDEEEEEEWWAAGKPQRHVSNRVRSGKANKTNEVFPLSPGPLPPSPLRAVLQPAAARRRSPMPRPAAGPPARSLAHHRPPLAVEPIVDYAPWSPSRKQRLKPWK